MRTGVFRYLRDPLFLSAAAIYATNRCVLKPHLDSTFLHSYFNDLILIPCALPPVLLAQRRLNLRSHDGPPQAGEILLHLLAWSVLFEWIGPSVWPLATGDWLDVVCYSIGGLIAGLWWHWSGHSPWQTT